MLNYDRWKNLDNLKIESWKPRSTIIAKVLKNYLNNNTDKKLSILDIGCGAMTLEKALVQEGFNDFNYIPSDIFQRDERTLIIDFNDKNTIINLPDVDFTIFSGVLEYLTDIDDVFRKVAEKSKKLIFSYSTKVDSQSITQRRKVDWINDFTKEEIMNKASNFGKIIGDYQIYNNQIVCIVEFV